MRTIRDGDAEQILDIYAPFIRKTAVTFELEAPGRKAFEARVRGISAQFPFIVCEDGARLAGYAYASPQHERAAYQWNASLSIYLRGEYSGKGLGRRLYGALIDLLACLGYMNLYALVTLPNPASIGLHEKFGFRELAVQRKTGYKLGSWHDVAIFEKTLGEHVAEPPAPRSIYSLASAEIGAVLDKWQPCGV